MDLRRAIFFVMGVNEVSAKNYFVIRNMNPFVWRFGYLDLPDYYADDLFVKHGVPVRFEAEFTNPEKKYRVVTASCLRPLRGRVEAALRELPYIMALNGYGDYEAACDDLLTGLAVAKMRMSKRR